jgi:hypothetical protein
LPLDLVCYDEPERQSFGTEPCTLILKVSQVEGVVESELLISGGSIQLQNASNSTLLIYDILGKELIQGNVRSDNETIDLNHLPNGILMVVLETEKSRITKKVVKLSN